MSLHWDSQSNVYPSDCTHYHSTNQPGLTPQNWEVYEEITAILCYEVRYHSWKELLWFIEKNQIRSSLSHYIRNHSNSADQNLYISSCVLISLMVVYNDFFSLSILGYLIKNSLDSALNYRPVSRNQGLRKNKPQQNVWIYIESNCESIITLIT